MELDLDYDDIRRRAERGNTNPGEVLRLLDEIERLTYDNPANREPEPPGVSWPDEDEAIQRAMGPVHEVPQVGDEERPFEVERFPRKEKGPDGEDRTFHYFRVKAVNGETVAQSEGYNSAQARDKTAFRLAGQTQMVVTTEGG